MMICPVCFKEFTPRHKQQRYCSRKHYNEARDPKRRKVACQMCAEWLAWKEDFAKGLTISNTED